MAETVQGSYSFGSIENNRAQPLGGNASRLGAGVRHIHWIDCMTKEKEIQEQWNQLCSGVASRMRDHILPFSTPISRALSNEYGEQHGSGSYVQSASGRFLVTNEHVACRTEGYPLAHQFWKSENVFRGKSPWVSVSSPVDVAACQIDESVWGHSDHSAQSIPLERFAEKHNPEERELLFFAGYSGDRSKFLFEHLLTPGTPYLTQEESIPSNVSEAREKYHFALPYKPDKAVSVNGSSELPRPPGFSGSLVWDTKRVACMKHNTDWSPEMAEVTGIVWGWPSSQGCILATRVEHIRIQDLLILAEKYA